MTPRRAACLAAVLLACAVAVPILHAGSGRTPPASSGPLTPAPTGPVCVSGPGSPVASCVFDYQLDPSATSDPSVAWHAFWTTTTGPAARRGFCTIQAVQTLGWSGPAATRSYPPAGSSNVATGGTARLSVDAAGHATQPASLSQTAGWPPGIVTAATYHGALVVLWQGRTTRAVPATLAAEVASPGTTRPFVLPPQPSEVGVPCAHLPPPGQGSWRVWCRRRSRSEAPHGYRCGSPARASGPGRRRRASGRSREPRPWRTAAGAPRRRSGSRIARPFGFKRAEAGRLITPGRYVVHVTLHGPTGKRVYRLPFVVR